MDEREKSDAFVDELETALKDVFSRNQKMLTKFVLVVENFDGEGDRSIWVTKGEDTYPWDAMGLLEFVRNLEQAKVTTHHFIDHGIEPGGHDHG